MKDSKDLVQQMTTKEKADATVMEKGRCAVVERLELNGFMINDNPRGMEDYEHEPQDIRKEGEYYPVSFPQAAALAATWDENIAFEVGAAMGRACKLHGIDVLLRPGVNMKRSPLCGRNFEYYAEDPVVAGNMGAAFINGVQSEGTAACLKHYAVNSQEFERMTTNAVVSERALREIYLKAFEIAIKKSHPWTVMTSYNKVNGQWVPENEQLMSLLRDEFGFDGAVISDALAVQTEKIRSHRYGLDFEIGGRGAHTEQLQDAINSGRLDIKYVDENIMRLLKMQQKIDAVAPKGEDVFETDHALARKIAAEAVVLLENDGTLPLDADYKQTILVMGELTKTPNTMGGGSGHMNGHEVEITYDEIVRHATAATVKYVPGYALASSPEAEEGVNAGLINQAAEAAVKADLILFFTGLPFGYESEGFDRHTLALPVDQTAALDAVLAVNQNVVLVNASGSAVDLSAYKGKVKAIVHTYLAGEAMGGALADVLFGKAEPSGHLTETFPLRLQDTPAYLNFPAYPTVMRDVLYGEDIYIGYRWYEKREIPVLFPFGHGLSYTTFEYGPLTTQQEQDTITASISIKNTGTRRGAQVVQLYVKPIEGAVARPVKELKSYKKVWLQPEEQVTVTFSLERDAFSYFDEEQHKWICVSGRYELLAGVSAAEIIGKVEIDIVSDDFPILFHNLTALEWVAKDTRTKDFIGELSKEAQGMLVPQEENFANLMYALPVYRLSENTLFKACMSADEFSTLLDKLNNK